MFNRLLQQFSPPKNLDDERATRSWLLIAILLPTMAITLLVGFIDSSLGDLRWGVLGLFGLEVLALILLRLGKISEASNLFLFSATVFVTLLAYFLGGLNSAVLYFSIAILLLSGILVSSRAAIVVLIVNITIVSIFYLLDESGLLPVSAYPTTLLRRWASYVGTYFLVSVLMHLSLQSIRSALIQSRQNATELMESNRNLQDIRANLEERVQERTRALEQRAVQLQAAAEVGHAAVSINNLNDLFNTITTLISERFGYYHVGIFLLDTQGEYAELRAANSEGGLRMLARNHRLKVGETGIVGYVTNTRRPRIALDVGRDATFFNNPDLPDTRSEMALPLVVGDTLLGALDIQSTKSGAFSEEDVEIMLVLADQLAIAIQNARLLTENQTALDAARRAYQEMSLQSWEKFLQQRQTVAYLTTPQMTQQIDGEMSVEMQRAYTAEKPAVQEDTLALPIKIRSNTTGVIRLKKPAQTTWSEKEIDFVKSLTDQLSQALEAARLYSETQQRAERERLTAEVVNRIRSSNNPQEILQTALSELRQALKVQKAQVLLENGTYLESGNGKDHIQTREEAG
jgi:GAF domain-containing protein